MLLKFKIDKEMDKKLIKEFLNTSIAGNDFSKSIIRLHPKMSNIKKLDNKIKEKEISDYVEKYYQINSFKIINKLKEIEITWEKIEKRFFLEIKKLFNLNKILSKNYISYFSIINACPRWISKREFCIAYNLSIKKNIALISHELLHFFFYEHINKDFRKKMTNMQKWHLSEIFNVIILNKNNFKQFFYPLKEEGYPEHEKILKKFEEIYVKSNNLKEFIDKSIIEIRQIY